MTTIPGASGYLNASTLANARGIAAQSTDLLSSAAGSVSILDAGRSGLLQVKGVGLSASARQLNKAFIEKNGATANGLFSATIGQTATVDGLKLQILALRSGKSERELASDLIQIELEDGTVVGAGTGAFAADDGSVAESDTGTTVDTEA